MKKLLILVALGVPFGFRSMAQEAAPAQPDAKPSAAQIENLNKQIEAMRKQLDATQAQLQAMKGGQAPVAPVAPVAPIAPEAPVAPVAPVPPVPPDASMVGEVSRLGGSYTVQKNEVVNGDARVVGGPLTIDGVVRGDASVIGGPLTVNGSVEGDATVTGGPMTLGPDAVVRGDVVVTGGPLNKDPGARVYGDIREGGGRWSHRLNGPHPFDGHPNGSALFTGPFPFPMAVTILLLGGILLAICPKRIDTIGRSFVNQPMHSLLIGIASVPLAIILGVVSLITVVGPVLIGFGMALAFAMGVTAVVLMLGRRIALGKTYRSRFYPLVVGLMVWLAASTVSHMAPPVLVLVSIATVVGYFMAVGAAIGTGFGKNPGWLRNRMSGNSGGTPWVDPNYTYAGAQDAYRDIA